MDKRTFLKELRRHLEALPFEEREEAVSYYEEYLEEAGPTGEAEAIEKFGSPKELAQQILEERQGYTQTSAPPPPQAPPQKEKSGGMSSTTKIILLIVTAPITIPLAFSLLGALGSLFIGFISLVFGFGVAGIAMVGGGIFTLISAFGLALTSTPTFVFFLGASFVVLGLGVLFFLLAWQIATWIPRLIARLCRFIKRQFQKEVN